MSEEANSLKDRGNTEFKAKRFNEAIALYSHGLEISTDDALKTTLYSNSSICYLKLNDYENALKAADNGLLIASTSASSRVKLWYRRGLALFGLNNYDEALAQFQKIASHPDVDPENKRLARIELTKCLAKKAPMNSATSTPSPTQNTTSTPFASSGAQMPGFDASQIDLNATPTKPGMFAPSHDIHVTTDVNTQIMELMQEAMKNGGKMTAEQQAKFNALTSGATITKPAPEPIQDEEVNVDVPADNKSTSATIEIVEDDEEHVEVVVESNDQVNNEDNISKNASVVEDAPVLTETGIKGKKKEEIRGVWAKGGGKALSSMVGDETVVISLPEKFKSDSRLAKLDANIDQNMVQNTYSALPQGFSYSATENTDNNDQKPHAAVASIAVSVLAMQNGNVLMVDRGSNNEDPLDIDESSELGQIAMIFKDKKWYFPQRTLSPSESYSDSVLTTMNEQCKYQDKPAFDVAPISVVAAEDYPSLQNNLWMRYFVATGVQPANGFSEDDVFAAKPENSTFAWIPIDLVMNKLVRFESMDVWNVLEFTDYFLPMVQYTIDKNLERKTKKTANDSETEDFDELLKFNGAIIPSSVNSYPQHLVEAVIVSLPDGKPSHPHVLLTKHRDGVYSLPTTDIHRGETFIFGANRVSRAKFGLVLKDWVLLSVDGGLGINGGDDIPDEDVIRGVKLTLATLTQARPISTPSPSLLSQVITDENGTQHEIWPEHDTIDISTVDTHLWVDFATLTKMKENNELRCDLYTLLCDTLRRAETGESYPTILGLPNITNVDSVLAASNQNEEES